MAFQCKRYTGKVGPGEIRDFRGALDPHLQGIFITTGTFIQSAEEAARKTGERPISLVDGYELVEKMKEVGLGVTVSSVENGLWHKTSSVGAATGFAT